MKVRIFQASDYPEISRWWEAHGWPALPLAILPPLSVVVEADDGRGLCAAFAYMDNGGTGVAMIEWIVTAPENSPRESWRAIGTALDFLKGELKSLGYGCALTTCRDESLARVIERAGFQRTDGTMIHLLTNL